jgi:hypothetical protein
MPSRAGVPGVHLGDDVRRAFFVSLVAESATGCTKNLVEGSTNPILMQAPKTVRWTKTLNRIFRADVERA